MLALVGTGIAVQVASQALNVFPLILLGGADYLTAFTRPQLEALAYGSLTLFGKQGDRKSTRLNSSHVRISYAVFCLKKKTAQHKPGRKRCIGDWRRILQSCWNEGAFNGPRTPGEPARYRCSQVWILPTIRVAMVQIF